MSRCGYDSGSMTGNRPLCDDKATHRVSYWNGSLRCHSEVCERHVRTVRASAYPSPTEVVAL